MLTANSQFDVRPGLASQVARNFHQASDALLIDRCERVCIDNIELGVGRQKTAGIVAAHAKRCLRKIICPEAEKLCLARDLVGDECGTGDFNHCPDQIVEFRPSLLSDCASDTADDVDLKL